MGFKEIRALLIDTLESDNYDHERRPDIREKNLLYTGDVDLESVIRLLRRCAGWEYSTSQHHFQQEIWCHTFTPQMGAQRWYIKAYFRPDGVAMLISVHQ